jgi:hypothetical protein
MVKGCMIAMRLSELDEDSPLGLKAVDIEGKEGKEELPKRQFPS